MGVGGAELWDSLLFVQSSKEDALLGNIEAESRSLPRDQGFVVCQAAGEMG